MKSRRQAAGYWLVVLGGFVAAVLAGFTTPAAYVDNDVYDWLCRMLPAEPWPAQAVLLTVDEETLSSRGGMRKLRSILAEGLRLAGDAGARMVAVDVVLTDAGDAEEDAALAEALCGAPHPVLAVSLAPGGGRWEDPLPELRRCAEALGHVHADPDALDGVMRQMPLEKVSMERRERRWALALEAWRIYVGAGQVEESPQDLKVGEVVIPAPRQAEGRLLWIRYQPLSEAGAGPIPRVSIAQAARRAEARHMLAGKAVFLGVTAQTAARDRLLTPFSEGIFMPGVEIHASAFETLAGEKYLETARPLTVFLVALGVALAGGLTFAFRSGWQAYALGALLLAAAHALPVVLYAQGTVFPYFMPVSAAWLPLVGAAAYQHFVVRRQLRKTEREKARYQEAMHFVTHELKTPLTAIQGSSELISRYPNLSPEKRRQIAELINTESKRLARMIETFLSVERLSAGQMELRREEVACEVLTAACVERARALAERKQIRIEMAGMPEVQLEGDRELLDYAIFNLLSNAVKYSPAGTVVRVGAAASDGTLRLSVRDEGYGMDAQELKNLFQKFYRTRRAEQSGEKGTGLGLCIVKQIVEQHGGRVEVESAVGKGSCFTMVLPLSGSATAAESGAVR